MQLSIGASALVLLSIFSSFGAAQERADGPPSETLFKTAERNITLVVDPHFPVSLEAIDEIIQSNDLASAAIGELTGARANLISTNDGGRLRRIGTPGWSPEKSGKQYFSYVQNRQRLVGGEPGGSFPLRLVVAGTGNFDETELAKYAQLVIKHLNNVLADLSHRAFESKRKELSLVAEQAQKTVELARQKLNETRDSVRRASGDFSESTVQELVTNLKKQEQALEVELAGMKGRARALQTEVSKTAERVKKEPTDDEIVKNLTRVIELRTQQHQILKQLGDKREISKAEIAKAEEQVALARVELAQAKRANSRPASDQLDKLNTELAQIAVSMAESEAKLKYVTEQLEVHTHILKEAADAKPLREQLDKQTAAFVTWQAHAEQAAAEVRQLESSFRPARVEAFDLKSSEEKPGGVKKGERK